MYWILAAIFLMVALAVPRLRPIGVIGCIILAIMLGWGMVQRLGQAPPEQRGRPSSPAAVMLPLAPDLVGVDQLQLLGGGAPFELRGQLENRSKDTLLKSITVLVTRRDCYQAALDPSGCVVLWQDRHWVAVSVPPLEQRTFSSSIWMRGAAPAPRGTVKDEFQIVAAAGELVPAIEK